MAKITLSSILSGFNLSKINANFQAIQDVLNNKVLFRDNPVGEPNTVQQDIDMNGKNLLNVGTLGVSQSFQVNGLDLATQVQNAANSATASANSATQSANSATSSATSLDSFKKQYQGRSASAPTTRYDGSTLQVGDLYFNTTLNAMQVYGNSGWVAAGSSVNGTSKRATYTYSSGAPTFTVNGGYDAGYVDVYLNGYKLVRTSDFDDTSGSTITINRTLIAGDIVDIVAYGTFNIANVYTKSESDAYRASIYSRIGDTMSVGYRNRIHNGNHKINQRNLTSSSTNGAFLSDRWSATISVASATPVLTSTTSSSVSRGGGGHIQISSGSTIKSSLAASDLLFIRQGIEGYNIADLLWGSSSAKTVTISFRAVASANTTIAVSLRNGATNRSYVSPVAITTTNDTYSITVPGDQAVGWTVDNSAGINLQFCVAAGSTYTTATANTWQAGNYVSHSSCSNIMDTANRTVTITDVQFEAGNYATPFEIVDYGDMLRRCQRYLPAVEAATYLAGYVSSSTAAYIVAPLSVPTRVSPTGLSTTISGALYNSSGSAISLVTLPFGSSSPSAVIMFPTVASGLVAGNGTLMKNDNKILFTGCEL
jgi:hypothetical protein